MANGRMLLPDERLPAPPARRYGLLSTATELTGLDRHWQAGLTWQANCPRVTATYDECLVLDSNGEATLPEPPDKAQPAEQTIDQRGATPFTAFAEVDCSAVGSWNRGEAWAADALRRDEQRHVERSFFLGAAGGAQSVWPNLIGVTAAPTTPVIDDTGVLLQPAVDDVTPATGPVDIVLALSILEAALADCYSEQGFIHMPIGFGALLSAWHLVSVDGDGDLVTQAGNKVVLGAGYTGDQPGGGGLGGLDRWMYATGQVFYVRGEEIRFTREESFDREKNTLKAIAERTYVVGWDCCLLAIGVDTATSGACCEAGLS